MNRRFLLTLPVSLWAQYEESKGEVPWVPTPDPVIDAAMRLAACGPRDTVYDLGSGDGRVLLYSAKHFGARGVGVEIEGHRVAEARAAASSLRLSGRVRFVEKSFYEVSVAPASIVFLYVYTAVMAKLKPKLMRELRPGARIVAYQFNGMGDWKPESVLTSFEHPVYLWRVPPRMAL